MQTERALQTYQTYAEQLGTNIVHPLAGALFAIVTMWTFFAPRRYVPWTLLIIACFISPAQRFAFMTLDFHFLRAITILVVLRILIFSEYRGLRLRGIDYAIVLLALTMMATGTFRLGSFMFVNKFGHFIDNVGLYMIGRVYVRRWEDLRILLLGSALAAVPVTIFFLIEQFTQWNFFSLFGGVPDVTVIRQGNLRAQGAFSHPIIAGLFWAVFAGMFVGVILSKARTLRMYFIGWAGTIGATITALTTNSSTSIACLLVVAIGWLCFPYRMYLRSIRWLILAVVLFVHFIHPFGVHKVVFTSFTIVSGSTGYHRYMLIEGALAHIDEWMFYGATDKNWNIAFHDITCDYVATATNGGMLALILEIMVITLAFYAIGRAMKAARNREELCLSYGMGCALLALTVGALAVTIYGQAELTFWFLLGMAASMGQLDWLRDGKSIPTHTEPPEHVPLRSPVGGTAV